LIIQRRNFLIGLASSLAAPAIVRASSLMPVKALKFDPHLVVQRVIDYYINYPIELTELQIMYGIQEIKPELCFYDR